MNSNSTENAENLFKDMVQIANNGKQRLGTLARLKEACDVLVSQGKDFTRNDIQIYCKRTFNMGPNAQTIYNDKSLDRYVEARKSEATLRKRRKAPVSLQQQIESIEDLELKSHLRVLYDDRITLRKKLEMISSALANLNPPLDLEFIFTGRSAPELKRETNIMAVDERYKIALSHVLKQLLENSTVVRFGLDVDDGDIVSRGMRETLISKVELDLLSELYRLIGGVDILTTNE